MSTKRVVAIAIGLAIAVASVSPSFAIDPRLSDALGRGAQEQGIKNAIGNMGQLRDGIGRASEAASGGARAVPQYKGVGCINWWRC